MPVLNLLAYPRDEWPSRLWDVMLDPAGAEGGALFDAMEASALLSKKRGRYGSGVRNHLLLHEHQLRSGKMWRGLLAGQVLMLTLAKAEAGEKRTSVNAALSDLQPVLQKRLVWGRGGGITELKATWQGFRPTAHLWAAREAEIVGDRYDPLLVLEWITVAEELRRRGEALRPPNAKNPVLDPCTTWKMPDELELPAPPLTLPSVDSTLSKIESPEPPLTI